MLDEYLQDEDILDIRAKFYEKVYIPNKTYISLKFLKDGKVISHYAKAYRGLVLRSIAQNSIKTKDELINMQIDKLDIKEIQEQKLNMK